jgi:hypothetical protein
MPPHVAPEEIEAPSSSSPSIPIYSLDTGPIIQEVMEKILQGEDLEDTIDRIAKREFDTFTSIPIVEAVLADMWEEEFNKLRWKWIEMIFFQNEHFEHGIREALQKCLLDYPEKSAIVQVAISSVDEAFQPLAEE